MKTERNLIIQMVFKSKSEHSNINQLDYAIFMEYKFRFICLQGHPMHFTSVQAFSSQKNEVQLFATRCQLLYFSMPNMVIEQ